VGATYGDRANRLSIPSELHHETDKVTSVAPIARLRTRSRRYRVGGIVVLRKCRDPGREAEAALLAARLVKRRRATAAARAVEIFEGTGRWQSAVSSVGASGLAALAYVVWLVRGEHPTWGELLGSLIVLVGLALPLGLVDALAAHGRTAASPVTPVS
jgi:hypothetical protein